MKFLAERQNKRAIELEQAGNHSEAIRCYRKAIESDSSWSVPWYNLGLLYKRKRDWNGAFECNLRAVTLDPSDLDAWWNLGISATAIENWSEARRAWIASGIPLDETEEGPVEMEFGPTPVRVNTQKDGEVVWCERIDPARAIIRCVPMPDSDRRYGDLLLHDGEPQGYRVFENRQVPVFNELQLLQPSEYGTFDIILTGLDEFEIQGLIDTLGNSRIAAEDWSSSLKIICRACSEGIPHDKDHPHLPDTKDLHSLGVAARSEEALSRILANWFASRPRATIVRINCSIEPARADGKKF